MSVNAYKYAMLRIREARNFIGFNSTDVFSKGTQLKGRSELRPIHMMKEHDDPKEYLADPKANVARIVGFKLDFFENFLPRQTQQNQEIIHDLMMGETTGDIAKKYGLSAGRISQLK